MNGTLFVQQWEIGLMKLAGDSLVLVPREEKFPYQQINVMLPYRDARGTPPDRRAAILIGTAEGRLFLYDGVSVAPFSNGAQEFLEQNAILNGTLLSDGTFAFGTWRGGVAIIDRDGNFLERVDKTIELQDNQVHSVFQDAEGGIWLGLENNLARLEAPGPFSIVDEGLQHQGQLGEFRQAQGRSLRVERAGAFCFPSE